MFLVFCQVLGLLAGGNAKKQESTPPKNIRIAYVQRLFAKYVNSSSCNMHFNIDKWLLFSMANRDNTLRIKVIWTFSHTSSIQSFVGQRFGWTKALVAKGSAGSQALFFSPLFALFRSKLPFYVVSFPALSVHSYTGLLHVAPFGRRNQPSRNHLKNEMPMLECNSWFLTCCIWAFVRSVFWRFVLGKKHARVNPPL